MLLDDSDEGKHGETKNMVYQEVLTKAMKPELDGIVVEVEPMNEGCFVGFNRSSPRDESASLSDLLS